MAESDRTRDALATLRADHDRCLQTHAASTAEAEGRCSELRAELKMRSFELASLGVTTEAKAAALREANLQADALQAQVK